MRNAAENYAFEDAFKMLEELAEFKCSMLEMANALGLWCRIQTGTGTGTFYFFLFVKSTRGGSDTKFARIVFTPEKSGQFEGTKQAAGIV